MGWRMQKLGLLGCVGLFAPGRSGLVDRRRERLQQPQHPFPSGGDGKWANVQSSYQRRNDLIPNLVDTVKASANFEKSTLTDVINARANATKVTIDPAHAPTDPAQLDAYQKAQSQLGSSFSRLLVSVEKYPELNSVVNFRDLQSQEEGTENRINDARNQFNDSTVAYNTARNRFPTVLYANFVGMKEKPRLQG